MTGVRTDRGDLPADLVIDATGRRSPVDDWLAQIGARPTATWWAECGVAYALDRLVAAHVVPFYQDQAAIDSARLAVMRHTIFGESLPPPPPEVSGRVSYPQLWVAACYYPAAFRAFWKINGMVCPPEDVYTDPHVVACTREALSQHGSS